MLDSNLMSLLTLLSENDYLTAQTLAVKSGASSRTVQTRIGQLRAELEGHGATVESRQRHGYRLRVEDRNAYETWYNENRHSLASAVPNTVEDRFRFLLDRGLRPVADIPDVAGEKCGVQREQDADDGYHLRRQIGQQLESWGEPGKAA